MTTTSKPAQALTFATISGGRDDVREPDWSKLIPGGRRKGALPVSMRETAHDEWVRITNELTDAETLSQGLVPAVTRLVLAYLHYHHAMLMVARDGAVVLSPKTKVPQYNTWFTVATANEGIATKIEAELCITPRRRGAATKAKRRAGTKGPSANEFTSTPRRSG